MRRPAPTRRQISHTPFVVAHAVVVACRIVQQARHPRRVGWPRASLWVTPLGGAQPAACWPSASRPECATAQVRSRLHRRSAPHAPCCWHRAAKRSAAARPMARAGRRRSRLPDLAPLRERTDRAAASARARLTRRRLGPTAGWSGHHLAAGRAPWTRPYARCPRPAPGRTRLRLTVGPRSIRAWRTRPRYHAACGLNTSACIGTDTLRGVARERAEQRFEQCRNDQHQLRLELCRDGFAQAQAPGPACLARLCPQPCDHVRQSVVGRSRRAARRRVRVCAVQVAQPALLRTAGAGLRRGNRPGEVLGGWSEVGGRHGGGTSLLQDWKAVKLPFWPGQNTDQYLLVCTCSTDVRRLSCLQEDTG